MMKLFRNYPSIVGSSSPMKFPVSHRKLLRKATNTENGSVRSDRSNPNFRERLDSQDYIMNVSLDPVCKSFFFSLYKNHYLYLLRSILTLTSKRSN